MARSLSFQQSVVLGVVVVACLGTAAWALLRIGAKSGYWDEAYELVVYVPDAQDLDPGTPVRIRGVEAGKVVAIEDHLDTDQVRLRLRINKQYRDRLFADAHATIVTKGLLGTSYVAISPGTAVNGALAENVIRYQPQADISARAAAVLDRAEMLAKDLEAGKGTVGALLKDDSLYLEVKGGITELRSLVKSTQEGMGDVRSLIKNTDSSVTALRTDALKTLTGANESIISLQREIAGVKDFVRSGQDAILAIKQDAEAIKSLPIIRSYVEDTVQLLVRPNMNRERVSYADVDLFEPGRAILTETGRGHVQKIADWLNGNKHKGSDIVVASFADPTDKEMTSPAARALTKTRSEVVAEALKDKGVHKMGTWSRNRSVTAVGMGMDATPISEKEKLPASRTEIILFTAR